MKAVAVVFQSLYLVLVWATTVAAQVPHPGTIQRPLDSATGTIVVPDHFLRSWDPVTIFFDRMPYGLGTTLYLALGWITSISVIAAWRRRGFRYIR